MNNARSRMLCMLYISNSLQPECLLRNELQKKYDFHPVTCSDALSLNIDFDIYEVAVIDSDIVTPTTIEIIQKIRETNCHIPIIVYIHVHITDHEEQVIRNGANHYLVKTESDNILFTYLEMIQDRIHEFNNEFAIHRLTESTVFNSLTRELKISSKTWRLRDTEAFLLHNLSNNQGHIVCKERLIYLLWGKSGFNKGTELKKYICFLRNKLKFDPEIRLEFRHPGYILYKDSHLVSPKPLNLYSLPSIR